MSHASSRPATTLALALSAVPIALFPATAAAHAADPGTKAGIEHQEAAAPGRVPDPRPAPASHQAAAGDATAWQLALSAALGALVTGGVVTGFRRVGHHPGALAS